MPALRCRACGGTYVDVLPDGVRYFHVCPPLSDAEVKIALALPLDDALLTDAQRQQLAAADRARPNARNENVDPAKVQAALDASGQRRRDVADVDLQIAAGTGAARV